MHRKIEMLVTKKRKIEMLVTSHKSTCLTTTQSHQFIYTPDQSQIACPFGYWQFQKFNHVKATRVPG